MNPRTAEGLRHRGAHYHERGCYEAAAHADNARFDAAVPWQTKAIEALPADSGWRSEFQERLDLYKARKPYRQAVP